MGMQFEQLDEIVCARLSGRLDSNNAAVVEQALLARIREGHSRLVIDLKNLDYISSAGLRVFLLVAKKLRQQQGQLSLCNLSRPIKQVFEISGFTAILKVCDDIDSARAAVMQSSALP